jgi:hypothetical protein
VPDLRCAAVLVAVASCFLGAGVASADTEISVPQDTFERVLVTPVGCADASCQQTDTVQTETFVVAGAEAAAADAALASAQDDSTTPPDQSAALAGDGPDAAALVLSALGSRRLTAARPHIHVLKRVRLHPRRTATLRSTSLPTYRVDQHATNSSLLWGIAWSEKATESFYTHASQVVSANNVAWVKDPKDITCNQGHGLAFSKTINRCAFVDDPARGRGAYFQGQDNFTISALVSGFPISASHYIHFKNTSDGGAYVSYG